MTRVIVTVKHRDEKQGRDLELPADFQAGRLAVLVARALNWESDAAAKFVAYDIEARPLGRLLRPDESLASAGVGDGAWLVLHPAGAIAPNDAAQADAHKSADNPLKGWLPLGIDLLGGSEDLEPRPEQSGFTWKQLD